MTASSTPTEPVVPVEPALEKVARIEVKVTPPMVLGELAGDERRMIAIAGGIMIVEARDDGAAALAGTILPGGSDIQLVRGDGTIELTARYAIDFGAAGKVLVENTGIRRESAMPPAGAPRAMEEPSAQVPYFRGVMQFRAPPGELSWLNGSVFVSSGRREGGTVFLDVFELA
jgi:hypothetical protein